MVSDDQKRTARRHALAPVDGETAGRVVDDPGRATAQPGLAQRAVVHDEAARDVIRDRPDESADDLHTQARRPPDEGLSTLPCHDPSDLTVLSYVSEKLRVRVCNAFEHGPRISQSSNQL